MADSLFQGTAQPTPTQSYVTSSTDYPKWLQDAIYNQINTATAIANTPYQEYSLPTVADLTPDQLTAFADIRAAQGSWQPSMDFASQGMATLATQPGQAAAANPYYQAAAGMSGIQAAQPSLQQQAGMLGGINYQAASGDLYSQQNQYLNPQLANYYLQGGSDTLGAAGLMDIGAQASPFFQQQANVLSALNYNNPATNLASGQNQYLSPQLANQYLQSGNTAYGQVGQMDIAAAANPYLQSQTSLLGSLNYNAPLAAMAAMQNQYLSPNVANATLQQSQKALNAAGTIDIAGSANPYIQQQMNALQGVNLNAPVSDLSAAQNQYLSPALANTMLQQGQKGYNAAGTLDIAGAANPYMQQASKSSVADIGQYMNPYQEGVMNAIAQQGARNLQENLLPAVSDAFIRAGQFGGSRMGEFGSRAVRDTQEAVLNQQSQAIQQGYTQALNAAQADQARQAQLASTAGQLTGQQAQSLLNVGQAQTTAGQAQQQLGMTGAQNVSAAQQQAINQAMQRASQYGQTAGLAGQLTGQQAQSLLNLGQAQGQISQAQQQAGLSAAQNLTSAEQQALTQAQQGAAQYGQAGQLAGQLTGQQAQSLLNLGQAQTSAGQTQQQYGLSAMQNLANLQQQALGQAQQTAAQYGQMGQNAGQLTGQQMSNLINLAQTQLGAGQAQQQTGIGAAQYLANLRQQDVGQALQGAAQYGTLGSTLAGLTQEQQKMLAGIGQNVSTATGADINTQMSALNNLASLASGVQGMQAKDAAAMEAIGQTQQNNMQQNLTAAYNQYMQQQLYQQQMADWMNTQIRGMAPITPSQTATSTQGNTYTYGPSPLSQLLGAYSMYKGFTQ
jgi:hypothetical protein